MTAACALGVRLGVPAYVDPTVDPETWDRLGESTPGSVVIVNPDSGPAAKMRRTYHAHVHRLRRRGILVYGYVDGAYGRTPVRTLAHQALAYRRTLRVDGVFLDQAPVDRPGLTRLARVARICRVLGLRTAVNPGRPDVDPAAFEWFDEVVTFEGGWETYAANPPAARRSTRADVWHLVYDVPAGGALPVVAQASARGATVVYATDLGLPNPWRALPSDWAEMTVCAAGWAVR